MNKSEAREVAKLEKYADMGATDMVARGLSALVRSAMTKRSREALMGAAKRLNVIGNPCFVI